MFSKSKFRFMSFMIIALAMSACSQNPLDKANHHLFLSIGQSNMGGRATIEAQDTGFIDRVFLLRPGDSTWERAKNPINIYSTCPDNKSPLMGPMWGFAKKIIASQKSISIGIIGNARGGTSIAEWMPGTNYFHKALVRTKAAQKTGTVKGICWHQGENDDADTVTYISHLATIIKAFRDSLKNDSLFFIAGQIYAGTADQKVWNTKLLTLEKVVPFTAVVSSSGCTMNSDNLHFNSAGQRLLGSRYADAMLKGIYDTGTDIVYVKRQNESYRGISGFGAKNTTRMFLLNGRYAGERNNISQVKIQCVNGRDIRKNVKITKGN